MLSPDARWQQHSPATVSAAAFGAPCVARVVVVVADEETASGLGLAGGAVSVLREAPSSPPGLNSAVGQGARWAARHHPADPVVVLTADLPTLTSSSLDRGLCTFGGQLRAYVPDRSGVGATALVALRPDLLCPRFGQGSARAHRETGAVELSGADERLRLDVDTLADLARAVSLGLRQHSLTTWTSSGPGCVTATN